MRFRSRFPLALALGLSLLLPMAAEPLRKAVEQKAEKDDPGRRTAAERAWFGGSPTPDYLEWKQGAARQEMGRWPHSFPGYKGELPAIPGASATWVNLGPKRSTFSVYSGQAPTFPDVDAGRLSVLGILTHPGAPQTLYIATSGGGLWKTTNADLAASGDWTWTCVTDGLPTATTTGNCSIGAVAMSPSDPNTLFLALGDQVDAEGKGLYKSTNGGSSWTELGTIGTTTRVMSLLVLDANTILVGGNRGVWRSADGGTSFNQMTLSGTPTDERIWSIQRVGTSTTNLVATKESAGTGTGSFWYSTNGGSTWTQASVDSLVTAQSVGRATVRGTAASSTAVYAIAENTTTGVFARGLFKSTNGGQSWTYLAAPTATGGLFQAWNNNGDGDQAFYNHCIAVDPANASNVFVGTNLSLYRTTDAGATWTQLTSWNSTNLPYAHADFHTSAWSADGQTLFVGNDGGLCVVRAPFRTTPPFTANPNDYATVDVTFVDNRRNRGITSHLVYNVGSTIASTPADSRYRVTLGLQDLSSRIRVDEGTGLQNSSTWNDPTGTGDGFGTVISPVDGDKMMVSSYYARPRRSVNGGANWASAQTGITGAGNGNVAPFKTLLHLGMFDPAGLTVYTSTNTVIYKTTDWAATAWTPVPMTGFTGTLIRNFNVSASSGQVMAIAANSGNVWVTSNGGSTWTNPFGGNIGSPNPGNLSYVWIDTATPSTLYVSSITLDSSNHHLWKTTNGGTTWTSIDGPGNGFPYGIPVHVIKNDPSNSSRLLAGTDFGVYISENGGNTWARYGVGMPMVAVRDLYIAPDGSFVRAATFGRGVWEISGGAPPAGPNISGQPQSVSVGAGQPASFTVSATGTGTLTYQWSKNGSPISGATGTTYVTSPTVSGDNNATFRVAVTDSVGTTNSNVATLTVTPCGGGGTQQLIQNPGFESGAVNWVTSTTQSSNYVIDGTNNPANAHTGTWYAWLCGYGTTTTETVYQQVTIPAGATSASLSFWLRIATTETSGTNDTLQVQVRDGSGGLITTLETLSNLNASAYTQKTYNLLAYAGQTIRIHFQGQENGSLYTSFFLDDFDLTVNTGAAATAPTVATQPTNQSATAGGSATFTVAANGTAPLYYQWRKNGQGIVGATSSSLTLSNVQAGDNNATIDCQIGNCAGVATSNPATLTVGSAVSVGLDKTAATVVTGGQVVFTATVTGSANPAVTWATPACGGSLSSTTANTTTFTAPATATLCSLTATSVASPGASATASITVRSRDVNGDGSVDILDLATFARAWGATSASSNWNPLCDLDGAGASGGIGDAQLNIWLLGWN